MKIWKILMGILLACVLVMTTPAPAPIVDVDANWTAGMTYLNGVPIRWTEWPAVSFDSNGRVHMGIASTSGLHWYVDYVEELTDDSFLSEQIATGDSPDDNHTFGPALTISTGGTSYLSYLFIDDDAERSELLFAYSNDGISWNSEQIAVFSTITGIDDYWTAIALNSSEDIHIIYTNPDTGNLTHAWYNETAWENDPVALNAGPVSSVVATQGGGLIVSYWDVSTKTLNVIEYSSGSWGDPVPVTSPYFDTTMQHAIAIDSYGNAVLLFAAQKFEGDDWNKLYLIRQTSGEWGSESVVDGSSLGARFQGLDLTMDGTTIHGVYSLIETDTNTLRYVTDSSGTLETSVVATSNDPLHNYYFRYPGISYYDVKPVIGSWFDNDENPSSLYVFRPLFNPTFTAAPSSGEAPLTVTVTAKSPIVPPSSVVWDFGNGDTGTGMTNTTVYDTAGSYTINMTATSGTTKFFEEKTVTVTSPPMGDDSSIREPEIQRASSTEPSAAGNATRASFNFSSDPVKYIEILGYVVPEDMTASVLTLNGPPDDTVPPGQVWRYLEMSLAGITKKDVLGAYVSFRIPEQVISSYGYTTEDVALVHLTENGWERLPTVLEKKEGAYVYYRAYTPGFSYFAIIFDEKASIRDLPELEQVIEENTSGTEDLTHTPTPEQTPAGANTTAEPTATTEPTKTPIPSVTVPVPETTPTQKSPAPLAGLLAGIAACAAWRASRRE